MEIGDKVRLLHSREEGIIRRFVDKRTVEIEIEEGFTIPVLMSEVVSIAKDETERFPESRQKENKPDKRDQDIDESWANMDDVLVALETKGLELHIWLINLSTRKILFTINSSDGNNVRGISSGSLKRKEYAKIDNWDLKSQENWPVLIVDLLHFSNTDHEYRPPISRKIRITDKLLVKKPQTIPFLQSKGVYISLFESHTQIDPLKIRDSFFEEKEIFVKKDRSVASGDLEIDLHIDSLVKNTQELNQQEILDIQLKHFENKLDEAVIGNAGTITFIHGVGNGTLRHKIHKILSQYPHVKYFEDAQKEKFGYGATKIHLK